MRVEGEIPAFPVTENWVESGLTKRELFAAMAMHAFLANPETRDTADEKTARFALQSADALLAALAEKGEE